MKFVEGAPVFAVEVRSEKDYGPASERAMARKRAEYFAAGTLVVWDVDRGAATTWSAHSGPKIPRAPRFPTQTASAEPAVPGWSMPVNDLWP